MTPYDPARVQAFVTAVGEDVLPFLTLLAYGGTGLARLRGRDLTPVEAVTAALSD